MFGPAAKDGLDSASYTLAHEVDLAWESTLRGGGLGDCKERTMKTNPYQLIESALEPGETLLWTGRQYSGPQQPKASINVVFFLLFGGIPLAAFISKFASGDLSPASIVLVLFPLVSILCICSVLIFDPKSRSGTCYAITDRHAMIVSGYRHMEIRSLWLGNITKIEVQPNDNGHGSIKCYAEYSYPFGKINNKGVEKLKPLFRGVANVQSVSDLLEREVKIQRAVRDSGGVVIGNWQWSDMSRR